MTFLGLIIPDFCDSQGLLTNTNMTLLVLIVPDSCDSNGLLTNANNSSGEHLGNQRFYC